ncbi:MAG: beta-ketoacyl-[acyl-carrier-protein] synthase family protein, partial [Planctomycetes bacterium]|nr:beta-ketoacyl-[acyl-carrier-protein] synthase family protein [Planctomycetota bacterium]
MSRRVVITGMGLIGPLGNCLDSLWSALSEGRSGVRALDAPPLDSLPIRFAGVASECQEKIDDFGELTKDQKKAIRKGLKVMCRECKMGVATAQRA